MKAVKIQWVDSFSLDGWSSLADSVQLTPLECFSIGFIIADRPDAFVLALTIADNLVCNRMVIPKQSIKQVTPIDIT